MEVAFSNTGKLTVLVSRYKLYTRIQRDMEKWFHTVLPKPSLDTILFPKANQSSVHPGNTEPCSRPHVVGQIRESRGGSVCLMRDSAMCTLVSEGVDAFSHQPWPRGPFYPDSLLLRAHSGGTSSSHSGGPRTPEHSSHPWCSCWQGRHGRSHGTEMHSHSWMVRSSNSW